MISNKYPSQLRLQMSLREVIEIHEVINEIDLPFDQKLIKNFDKRTFTLHGFIHNQISHNRTFVLVKNPIQQ